VGCWGVGEGEDGGFCGFCISLCVVLLDSARTTASFFIPPPQPSPLTSPTRLQKEGHDSDPDPILLNPAHALVSTWGKYKNSANALADWMVREDGGQKVVSGFMVNGVVLYTKAPKGEERR